MNSGACLTCPQGYVLQGAICWSAIVNNPYCQTFNGITCTFCYYGWYLSNGVCVKANALCATYNQNNGNCITCVAGATFSNNKCLINSGCATNGTNGRCLSCPPGYTIFNNQCVSIIALNPYCLTFSGTTCTACVTGYYIGSNGNCVVLSTPCATYVQTSGACLTCPTGYILYGDICWSITLRNPFCSSFTLITCTACNPGFYLNKGICELGNALCATYDSNTGYCLTCTANNTLQNGLCLVNIGCLTTATNGSGLCLTCPAQYALFNGLCISRISLNPYCLTFSGVTCTTCQNNYYLGAGGICTALNSLCATYDMQTGACLSCPTGYTLIGFACWSLIVQNPHCQTFSGTTCNTCFPGYYLNNGVCIIANQYCATYSMTTGACLTCPAGYLLSGGLCLAKIACTTSNTQGACTSCPAGYQIYQNLCILIITLNPYCLTFQGTICTVCKPNYYLGSNGICIALSSACKTYNMQTGYCNSCPVGYILYNNQCFNLVFSNPYCQVFTGTSCTTCYNRYWLNNGICKPVNSLCVTYDQATGFCLSCGSGYNLQNGLCIKVTTCLTTVNGNCATCPAGFVVFQNNCIDVLTLNPQCATFSGTTCTLCNDGYYIGSNGICVALKSQCVTYNQNTGACLSCPAGYALFAGVCWNLAIPGPPNPYC